MIVELGSPLVPRSGGLQMELGRLAARLTTAVDAADVPVDPA